MTLDKLLQGPHGKSRWEPALSNEWGRLAQGNDMGVEATNTIKFIRYSDVPSSKKVTYLAFVCDERPLKDEKWRVRSVVGGDKLDYNMDSGSPATDLVETKIQFGRSRSLIFIVWLWLSHNRIIKLKIRFRFTFSLGGFL